MLQIAECDIIIDKKKRTVHSEKWIDGVVEFSAFQEVFKLFLKGGLNRSFRQCLRPCSTFSEPLAKLD